MTDNNNNERDSNMRDEDDGDDGEEVLQYNDFYELLGVDESEEKEVIFQESRELLAKYHPDISDHPNADEIYKSVNKAQSVLTDEEQRLIYNSLGHDEYVSRREKGGEMELSETAKANNKSQNGDVINSPAQGKEKQHSKSVSNSNTIESDSSDGVGFGERITQNETYNALTMINFGLTTEESVQKLYRQMWFSRVVMSTVFIVAAVAASTIFPMEIMKMWEGIGLSVVFSVQTTVFISVIFFAIFVGGVTGTASDRLLKPIVNENDVGSENKEKRTGNGKKYSKTSDNAGDDNTRSERELWDSPKRYSDTHNENNPSEMKRTNRSISYAPKMILIGMVLTIIGVIAPGSHPWIYISSVFSGNGVGTNPWLTLGGEGVESVVLLVNFTVGVTIFILITTGVLYSMHGVSRKVWWQKYVTKASNPFVTVWDTILMVLLSVLIMVVLVGVQEYPNVPVPIGHGFTTELFIIGESITSLTIAFGAVIITWFVVLLFNWK